MKHDVPVIGYILIALCLIVMSPLIWFLVMSYYWSIRSFFFGPYPLASDSYTMGELASELNSRSKKRRRNRK